MKIYLAIPYSHPDPAVREARFREANRAAAILLNDGHVVFSPISHSHPIACQCKLPKGYDFWKKQAESMILWCDGFLVFRLPGWKESEGIKSELKIAKSLKKMIGYMKLGKQEGVIRWTMPNS